MRERNIPFRFHPMYVPDNRWVELSSMGFERDESLKSQSFGLADLQRHYRRSTRKRRTAWKIQSTLFYRLLYL